jgi:predicted nucleic acid-binding protein
LAEIIVNSSPLQYLHQVGLLDLLPNLFGRIVVPDAVILELAAGRQLGVSLPEPESIEWVDRRNPVSRAEKIHKWDLGAGESAVLSLALERAGSHVVLDDKLARDAATQLQIPLLGAIGILLRAKREKRLRLVQPVFGQLTASGFRLSPATMRTALELAGE